MILSPYEAQNLVRIICSPCLKEPDPRRFLLRLLLTLYGKDALSWSWVTVRNAVWSPLFRIWLSNLLHGRLIPEPPSENFRMVGNLVLAGHGLNPDGDFDNLDRVLFFVTGSVRFYIQEHGGKSRIEDMVAR